MVLLGVVLLAALGIVFFVFKIIDNVLKTIRRFIIIGLLSVAAVVSLLFQIINLVIPIF